MDSSNSQVLTDADIAKFDSSNNPSSNDSVDNNNEILTDEDIAKYDSKEQDVSEPSMFGSNEKLTSPLDFGQQFAQGFAKSAEGKANILKEMGVNNVEVTPDRKLLLGGVNYDSSPKSMAEMVKRITADGLRIGLQTLPIIAADVASIPASVASGNPLPTMGANAAAGALVEAGSQGIGNALGSKEGLSGTDIAMSGAIQGAASGIPFAYAGATRGAGKVAAKLAQHYEESFPAVTKFFTGISEGASKHLVDLTKIGILPSEYLNKDVADPAFIQAVAKKTILGDGKADATSMRLGQQIVRLGQNAKTPEDLAVLANNFSQLTGMSTDTFHEIVKSGPGTLLQMANSPDAAAQIANSFLKANKITNESIGGEVRAVYNGLNDFQKKKAIPVKDIFKNLTDELSVGTLGGPQVLKDGEIVGVKGVEKETLQDIMKHLYQEPEEGSREALFKAMGMKGQETPKLTENMNGENLIGLTTRLKRLAGDLPEGSQVSAALQKTIKGLNQRLEQNIPQLAQVNAKYATYHQALRDLGLEYEYRDTGKALRALELASKNTDQGVLAKQAFNTINRYTEAYHPTGFGFVPKYNQLLASRELAGTDAGEAVGKFVGAMQNYTSTNDKKALNVVAMDKFDQAIGQNGYKFRDEALKHSVAKEYLSKTANFYRLSKLASLSGVGALAGVVGVPYHAALLPAVGIGMKLASPKNFASVAERAFAPAASKALSKAPNVIGELLARQGLGAAGREKYKRS